MTVVTTTPTAPVTPLVAGKPVIHTMHVAGAKPRASHLNGEAGSVYSHTAGSSMTLGDFMAEAVAALTAAIALHPVTTGKFVLDIRKEPTS